MTSGEARTTAGRGRLYDSVMDTIGDTPCIRINTLAPEHVRLYVKAEFFNPAASVKDRLAVSIIEEAERKRGAQARADGGRGHQRQHRHRPRDGLRRQGLSARGHDGRQLLDRAPQADAVSRRQGGADAARAEGLRHVQEGRGAGRGQRLVSRPPVRDRGQRPHPREHHGARDPGRFRGRAAGLLRHRLRHRRHRHRRRPRAARGPSRNQDHPQRARQRATRRQRPGSGA